MSRRSIDALTARQREILGLLARGGRYEEVAAQLGVSINTVRSHIRALYRKLGVRTRLEAVLGAMKRGRFEG